MTAGDRVFTATKDGYVSAFSTDGALLWDATPEADGQGLRPLTVDDPLCNDGTLYVPYSFYGLGPTREGGVFVLAAETGVVGGGTTPVGADVGNLAVKDDQIIYRDSVVSQFSAGSVEGWTFRPGTLLSDELTGEGDYAFVGDRIVWRDGPDTVAGYGPVGPGCQPAPGGCLASWRVTGGTDPVAVGSTQAVVGDVTGKVAVLNASDGSVAWSADVRATFKQPAAVAGSTILFVGAGGKLWAFPKAGCGAPMCDPLWTAQSGSPVVTPPAVGADVIYVGTNDGRLHAFDLNGCGALTCDPIVSIQTPTFAPITGGPIVADGQVYVASADGLLAAYGL